MTQYFQPQISKSYMLMRDAEGRKKEAIKVKQTTRQSNTTHPRQSFFLSKNELPRVGLEPTTLYTLLYQLSWLGPNLTSHSALEEQANMYMCIYM